MLAQLINIYGYVCPMSSNGAMHAAPQRGSFLVAKNVKDHGDDRKSETKEKSITTCYMNIENEFWEIHQVCSRLNGVKRGTTLLHSSNDNEVVRRLTS